MGICFSLGQHGHSEQWRTMPNMDTYYKATITQIRTITDKPIVVRSHPGLGRYMSI